MTKSAKPMQNTNQANQIQSKSAVKTEKSTTRTDSCQALDLSIHSKNKSEPKTNSENFKSALCKREVTKDTLKEFPVNTMTSQPASCTNAIMKREKLQPQNEATRQIYAPSSPITRKTTTLPQIRNEDRPQVLPLPCFPLGFSRSPIADLRALKSSSPISIPTPSLSPLSNHSAASVDDVSNDWTMSPHMTNSQSPFGK